MSRMGKSIETESRLAIARGWGRGEGKLLPLDTELSFRMMKMPWN